MFTHRVRCFPKETFLRLPLRLLAIVQLCIAFTVLCAHCGYPFMGELYEVKSRKLVYEALMSSDSFHQLPGEDRLAIEARYGVLQEGMGGSFGSKLIRSLRILIFDLPLFEQGWLMFSIVIPLLLLLRVEGAAAAVWVLPLLAVCYGVDNRLNGYVVIRPDARLFPSEAVITTEYLKKPLSSEISQQRDELMRGWRLYLVDRWAGEPISNDPEVFEKQVKKGEFEFNVAREAAIGTSPVLKDYSLFHQKHSMYILGLYIFWNLFFAYILSQRTRKTI